jgi:hypothetical protein
MTFGNMQIKRLLNKLSILKWRFSYTFWDWYYTINKEKIGAIVFMLAVALTISISVAVLLIEYK